MKRIWLLSFILLLSVGLMAAGQFKVLKWNLGTEPPSLDPALSTDTTSHQVIKNIFVGLTDTDDETMDVIPDLATHWEASEDGLEWTFYLRKDVFWTDGSPVTALDVVYGTKRTLDPATGSSYAFVLWIIEGAEAYNVGDGSVNDVGVVALDDWTVRFTLIQPAGYFPAIAGMWVCNPVPRTVIEKHGDAWTHPQNIVTNGPYLLGEWVHEDHIVLNKSLTYYDAANTKIDQIYCYMIVEASTAMLMYEAGDLDCVFPLPLEDMDRVKADPVLSAELNIAPDTCTYYYGFNNEKAPFDNPLVRKAFASAIDRQSLIDYVLKGEQKPAQTFTCPGIFGYIDGVAEGIGYPYDPEAAQQFLADAGYPNGEGFPEVTLMHNTSEGHSKIAQFVGQSFIDTLNVTVNIVNQEWAVYLATCREDAPQIYRMGWCADYLDANNWLNDVFNSKSGSNYANYNNPAFDALIEQAARESDPAVRLDLYRQAETLFCDTDAGIAPIYYYTINVLTKPYVVRQFASVGGEHWKNWDILAD